MLFSTTNGPRVEFNKSNLGTSLETIADDQGSSVQIESVNFANKTGSTVTVTLCKTKSATDYYYLHTFDVPAHDRYPFTDHVIVLNQGETLRALAGTGTAIDVSVVGIQANR